jgi:hypothetical protein
MSLLEAQVADASANSVQGAGIRGGLCKLAVTTTKQFFTLTAWRGRLINVQVTGDGYYKFDHVSSGTLDISSEPVTAEAVVTATTANIAGRLYAGPNYLTVPVPIASATPVATDSVVGILVAAVSGTIDVRIHPA